MMSVVVIDNGLTVETLGDVEANMWNGCTGVIDLYMSPTEKVSVDSYRSRVTFKNGNVSLGGFYKGEIFYAK